MAKLNLQEFIQQTGKTSITDWVKYNWLGVNYGPGPGPGPEPEPQVFDFVTFDYYSDQPVRLNDLITAKTEGTITCPDYIDYTHSNYVLPEGYTELINGRFERVGKPLDMQGFPVEIKVTQTKTIKVSLSTNTLTAGQYTDFAIMNSNGEYVQADNFYPEEGAFITTETPCVYATCNTNTYTDQYVIYTLPAGTYRLGSPLLHYTRQLRFYGLEDYVAPEFDYLEVLPNSQTGTVGESIYSYIDQVNLVYTDGSVYPVEEYTVTPDTVIEGVVEYIVISGEHSNRFELEGVE